ncbi:MAG: acyltransferase [Alphaproteobacteria bacterium]|nr:acyltransferase [Alphaproteobacteria bacterium]
MSLDTSFQAEIPVFDQCRVVEENLPDWWLKNNNTLLAPVGISIPGIVIHPGEQPPKDLVIIICSSADLKYIMCWGHSSTILIGNNVSLSEGVIACGSESTVVIGDGVHCTFNPTLNARNGGLIYAGPDGLWASNITIFTDDMHVIRDLKTGKRINSFGGNVIIDRHVWLGLDVLVLDGAVVGHDVVVGARSVVSKRLNPNSIYAGVPAKLIRESVTWAFEDSPL